MTHIGILCPTLTGHLNPMLALGGELQRRSHRVTVVGLIDGKAKVLAAGLEFLAIGTTEFPEGSTPQRSEERRVGKECRSRWSPDH